MMFQPFNSKNIHKIGDIKYSRDHLIEGGGQGKVFMGKTKENTLVAVKRISDVDTLEEKEMENVLRERDNFNKLNHHNIVKLLDFAGSREIGFM